MEDCERNGEFCGECDTCIAAIDRWEAEAPEREQRTRERLDSEGYYDDPEGWAQRRKVARQTLADAVRARIGM